MSDYGMGLIYLAFCLFYEAKGEPIEGMVAVGHVIVTRARERNMSVEAVITQPHQFSWYKKGISFDIPEREVKYFARCIQAAHILAQEILDGKDLDGANHYYNPHKVSPTWASKMEVVARIGNHVFLRG